MALCNRQCHVYWYDLVSEILQTIKHAFIKHHQTWQTWRWYINLCLCYVLIWHDHQYHKMTSLFARPGQDGESSICVRFFWGCGTMFQWFPFSGGFHGHGAAPSKWMVKFMEHANPKWMTRGYPYFRKPPMGFFERPHMALEVLSQDLNCAMYFRWKIVELGGSGNNCIRDVYQINFPWVGTSTAHVSLCGLGLYT